MNLIHELTGTTLTVDAYYPIQRAYSRHQNRSKAADGGKRVYDRNVEEKSIKVKIKWTHDIHAAVVDFFENKVKLALTPFAVVPDAGQNWINGDGGSFYARLWQDSFDWDEVSWHSYEADLLLEVDVGLAYGDTKYTDSIDNPEGYDEFAL